MAAWMFVTTIISTDRFLLNPFIGPCRRLLRKHPAQTFALKTARVREDRQHVVRLPRRRLPCTLSVRGIFLPTLKPAAVSTRVSLQISLDGQNVSVGAVVIHSWPRATRSRQETGMVLEFVEITPQDQERIRCYIHREITRHIAPGNA